MLQVIPPAWLRIFSAPEINQLLAGGESGGIDVADMKAHTCYSGGYNESDHTIRNFWKVSQTQAKSGKNLIWLLVVPCALRLTLSFVRL